VTSSFQYGSQYLCTYYWCDGLRSDKLWKEFKSVYELRADLLSINPFNAWSKHTAVKFQSLQLSNFGSRSSSVVATNNTCISRCIVANAWRMSPLSRCCSTFTSCSSLDLHQPSSAPLLHLIVHTYIPTSFFKFCR